VVEVRPRQLGDVPGFCRHRKACFHQQHHCFHRGIVSTATLVSTATNLSTEGIVSTATIVSTGGIVSTATIVSTGGIGSWIVSTGGIGSWIGDEGWQNRSRRDYHW
jgi:hypothetical protein